MNYPQVDEAEQDKQHSAEKSDTIQETGWLRCWDSISAKVSEEHQNHQDDIEHRSTSLQ